MSRVVFVSIDHFPKICGPPEYHLRSIKRLKQKVTLPEKTVEGMSRVVILTGSNVSKTHHCLAHLALQVEPAGAALDHTLPEKTVEGMSRVVLPYPSPPSGDMKNLPRAPSMFKNNYFAEM